MRNWILIMLLLVLVIVACTACGCALMRDIIGGGYQPTDPLGHGVKSGVTAGVTAITGSSYAGEIVGGVIFSILAGLGLLKYKKQRSAIEILVGAIEEKPTQKEIKKLVSDNNNKEIGAAVKWITKL